MSEATTGVAHAKARVMVMPKLSLPSDGATSSFAAASSCGERLVVDEAEHVDPLLRHPQPGEQQPYGEGIGAEHAQADPAAAQARPGPKQHRQPLARVVAAGEDDAVAAVPRVDALRDLDAVRDHLVLARRVGGGGEARLLRDGDAQVDPVEEEAPQRVREQAPGRVAGRVERRDGRPVPEGERRRAEHRGERLVHVEEVEALARERPAQLRQRARAEDEVRERAVARHDHRAAERDHARGGGPGRPWRGWRMRLKEPGGSLPISRRVSIPTASSARACASAWSTTPPPNDQE